MLLPALSKARASAQNIKCVSNLKQMTLGANIYAVDNDSYLPGTFAGGAVDWITDPGNKFIQVWWADVNKDNWMYQVWQLAGIDKAVFACPSKSISSAYGALRSDPYYQVGYITPQTFFNFNIGAAKRASNQVIVYDGWLQQSFYYMHPYFNGSTLEGIPDFAADLTCHGKKANYGFMDGHAASMAPNEMDSEKMFTNN